VALLRLVAIAHTHGYGVGVTDKWWEYVQSVSSKGRPADIAELTKISAPTISRWNPENKGGPARPDPDNVVRFAKAYERSPLEALIQAGYIDADDIGRPIETPTSMRDVSDTALLEELGSRLAERLEGDEAQDGLVGDDFIEDPGMDGMEDRDQG
jgi:hypothetical protein